MMVSFLLQGQKRPHLMLLTATLLLFSACVKCGEDVLLGEFELTPESRAYWDAVAGDETLTFVSDDGGEIELQRTKREEDMTWVTFFYLCMKNNDSAEEYYLGESLHYEYTGLLNGDTLLVRSWFNVYHVPQIRQLLLYDQATFSFQINREASIEGAYVQIMSSNRGNNISGNNLPHLPVYSFAAQKEINGQLFADVWYYEGHSQASIYVQKGKGIVAFGDAAGKVWIRKQS